MVGNFIKFTSKDKQNSFSIVGSANLRLLFNSVLYVFMLSLRL